MAFDLKKTADTSEKRSSNKNISELLKTEITLFGNFFSNKKKEDFYTEISVLLKAGITLKEAVTLIGENQKKEKFTIFFKEITDELVQGNSFSEITNKRDEFSDYEYYSLKIGEETGALAAIAKELGVFYARKNEQKRNIISALTYPVIIFSTAILVVVFMLKMVVPMFQDIFNQNKVELPGLTKFIISAADFIDSYGLFVLVFCAVLIAGRGFYVKKQWYKKYSHYGLLRVPVLGSFVRTVYLAQFTQAMSLLVASKVPVLKSIQLVNKMIDFYPLQEVLNRVEKSIVNGKTLSESIGKSKVFDYKFTSLIKVAEETNQTEFIFQRLNMQYHSEIQQKSKMLSAVLEPLIIVFIGVLVGVILVAMYLPMFKLSSVLG